MNFFALQDAKKLVKYVLHAKHRKATQKNEKLAKILDAELF